MANMSYCMFENTAQDLRQIRDELREAIDNGESLKTFIGSRSSQYEKKAVTHINEYCKELLYLFETLKDAEPLEFDN